MSPINVSRHLQRREVPAPRGIQPALGDLESIRANGISLGDLQRVRDLVLTHLGRLSRSSMPQGLDAACGCDVPRVTAVPGGQGGARRPWRPPLPWRMHEGSVAAAVVALSGDIPAEPALGVTLPRTWSRATSSAAGMNFAVSFFTSGSVQTDCLAITPLFQVHPRGWPFIAQSRMGRSVFLASLIAM